jgi:adenylosuccinate lyase
MDQRYANPKVTELWSPGWTYTSWLAIETRTLAAQIARGTVPETECKGLLAELYEMAFQDSDVADVLEIEENTRHDVAAFLQWLREPLGKEGRWVHFGLTSSDVVDTTQGMRFRQMHRPVLSALSTLVSEITRLTLDNTPIVGRTHGQVAEPMTMRARAMGWLEMCGAGAADLSRRTNRMAVCKLSGPVGTYAHNPPGIEVMVSRDLNLRPHGPGATQIASRAPLAAWASSANLMIQVCAKIAHDVRLMTLLGETKTPMAEGQVGSSSMAHKRNPVRAERIEGLARMGAGYASMLTNLGTWLERDIAHSSVERVAVPDLWHVVMFCLEETAMVLRGLSVQKVEIPGEAWVSWLTLRGIEGGQPVDSARAWALNEAQHATPQQTNTHMAHYPGER